MRGHATVEELERRLDALLVRQAVADTIIGIARGVDRYDQALLRQLIAPDAVFDMGGAKLISGAEFTDMLAPPATPRPGRMHIVSNQTITIEGDHATTETYITSCMDIARDGVAHSRVRAGRYLDRLERRMDRWVLTARTMIDEWGRVDAIIEDAAPGCHRGAPAPGDASYDHFAPVS